MLRECHGVCGRFKKGMKKGRKMRSERAPAVVSESKGDSVNERARRKNGSSISAISKKNVNKNMQHEEELLL